MENRDHIMDAIEFELMDKLKRISTKIQSQHNLSLAVADSLVLSVILDLSARSIGMLDKCCGETLLSDFTNQVECYWEKPFPPLDKGTIH